MARFTRRNPNWLSSGIELEFVALPCDIAAQLEKAPATTKKTQPTPKTARPMPVKGQPRAMNASGESDFRRCVLGTHVPLGIEPQPASLVASYG
jgi:hypothetical protein